MIFAASNSFHDLVKFLIFLKNDIDIPLMSCCWIFHLGTRVTTHDPTPSTLKHRIQYPTLTRCCSPMVTSNTLTNQIVQLQNTSPKSVKPLINLVWTCNYLTRYYLALTRSLLFIHKKAPISSIPKWSFSLNLTPTSDMSNTINSVAIWFFFLNNIFIKTNPH